MHHRRQVTVVGAGFSGLVAALELQRAGFRVRVLEKQSRVGGLISTTKMSYGFVESAAGAIINSPRVEELFRFTGLTQIGTGRAARNRFIFRHGRARRWPLGFSASLRFGFFFLKFLFFRTSCAPRPVETVRAWEQRVLGEEAGRYLLEAALQGIYAGDPSRLSASLVFGRYFRPRPAAAPPKLSPKSIRGSVSAPEGMGQLLARLKGRLENLGVEFSLSDELKPLEKEPAHPYIIATSGPQAARLLKDLDPARAQALSKIEMLDLASVNICFDHALPAIRGFGCLFPPCESRRALGVLLTNFIFPGQVLRGHVETWILGGAQLPLASRSDAELLNLAIEERQSSLYGGGEHSGYRISRWMPALPHYTVELENLLPELTSMRQNVLLLGNYLGEIGLSRMLDLTVERIKQIEFLGEWRDQGIKEKDDVTG